MELFGRHVIETPYNVVDEHNILEVLSLAYLTHERNHFEEKYLEEYYRGKQDILGKTKTTRPEINHIVTENRCYQIVDFWNGTMIGSPIVYTCRKGANETANKIEIINDFLVYGDKNASDKRLFHDMLVTGHGYRMVLPSHDDEETPFEIFNLDTKTTFVIYNSGIGKKPVAGVTYIVDENEDRIYSVYTKDKFFTIKNCAEIISVEMNPIGEIPIIEYKLNEGRLGIFEPAKDLIDALNYIDSDRMDSLTQFVNSLIIVYNAQLPDGEDGNTIREQGIIELQSTGENKADLKILSEQLDQTQNQTLKDDIYNAVLQIVGMPSQSSNNSSDSSNTGATYLRSGYQLTEMRAEGIEISFKKSEKEFLKLILRFCRQLRNVDLKITDVDIVFSRSAYSDLVSRSQILLNLLSNENIDPLDAWKLSGITSDPEEAYKRGQDYKKSLQKAQAETQVTTADNQGDSNVGNEQEKTDIEKVE